MKILVFTDIHGNLSALKQIIKTDDFKTADKRIFLGDVAFGFERPNQCIKIINKTCECIAGNNDLYVSDHIPDVDLPEFAQSKLIQWKYWIKNISRKNKKIINSWPKEIALTINNIQFYFTHYPWEEYNNDINVVDTPIKKSLKTRERLFKNIDADYIIFGHEHYTNCFANKKKHFYCVASAGLTKRASYLVIEVIDNQVTLTEKFIEFDYKKELNRIIKAGYPHNL